jgi:hypothetical protein
MTWRELKNFINKRARENKSFLDADVKLYDFDTGDENEVDITELSCSDDEVEENSETNWVAYLSINDKEESDETETKEAGVD